MNYFDIAPLTKIPLTSSQSFTYHCQKNIAVGSVVEITIINRKNRGIVIEKVRKPKFPTKEISDLIDVPALTKKQLSLAQFISQYYLTSLGIVLKLFVPRISKMKKQEQTIFYKRKTEKILLTAEQKDALKKILQLPKGKPALLFGPSSSGKTEVAFELIKKELKKNKQSLILIPELFLSEQEIERYWNKFGKKNIAFYNSSCTSSEKRYVVEGVKENKIKIVVATKAGLFLPFKALGLLVVDEEQDISFKQWDQMPHYHAKLVSEHLTGLYDARTLLMSATPSLETLQKINSRHFSKISLPALRTENINIKKPKIEIVNIAKYFKKNVPFCTSNELRGYLQNTLAKNELALILVPRRGKSARVLCQSCKQIQTCPNCSVPIVHMGDIYRCLHCSFKTGSFPRCEKCRSLKLVDLGFGTESVKNSISSQFPSARVEIVDKITMQKRSSRKKIFSLAKNNELDFIVGTYAVAKGLDLPQVSLVAVINADNWSGKTDFRFDEHRTRNLFQLAGRLNRPGSDQNGVFVIQTYSPPKDFENLFKWNWMTFAKKSLEERRDVGYPPITKMTLLTNKGEKIPNVEKKTKELYTELLEMPEAKNCKLSEPYLGSKRKIRGKYRMNILITHKKTLHKKLLKKLKGLSSDWSIDVDPEFIF